MTAYQSWACQQQHAKPEHTKLCLLCHVSQTCSCNCHQVKRVRRAQVLSKFKPDLEHLEQLENQLTEAQEQPPDTAEAFNLLQEFQCDSLACVGGMMAAISWASYGLL